MTQKQLAALLPSLPTTPGVYQWWDENGLLLYVGKAKNLRARLAQYRRAKRREKMFKVVKAGHKLTWETCENDLAACLREVELIQTAKPKKNVASAYSCRYPFLGIKVEGITTVFCFSTVPSSLPEFRFFGTFRSRENTTEALGALARLLRYVGHQERIEEDFPSYSYGYAFRRVPEPIRLEIEQLWLGHSSDILATLFARLLEHAGARANAAEVKEDLRWLRTFWEEEARPLRQAIERTQFAAYPVPQTDRDPLFLRAKILPSEEV